MTVSSLVISVLLDTKGTNVVRFELTNKDLMDDVILVTAQNYIHIGALANALHKSVHVEGRNRISGTPESGWVILDMGTLVVHVLLDSVRILYALDQLFSKRGVAYHH